MKPNSARKSPGRNVRPNHSLFASRAAASKTRPWRVLPLAIGAVIATLSVAAAASHAGREISHGRYAEDIIRQAL